MAFMEARGRGPEAGDRPGRTLAALRDRFPYTGSGLTLLLAAAGVVWTLGVKRLDLILLVAGLLLAALLLLLGLLTPIAGLWLRRQLNIPEAPLEVEAECEVWHPTGFRTRMPRWLPFLNLEVSWVEPTPEVELDAEGRERIRPHRRALRLEVQRRFTVSDLLGLTAFSWSHTRSGRVRLLPARMPGETSPRLRALMGGEEDFDPFGEARGDRVDLRRYGQGDPLRMILWKVWARTRTLMVRMPERAQEIAPRLCAFLPSAPEDEAPARLLRKLLEDGLLGEGWRLGTEVGEAVDRLEEALDAVAASGSHQPGSPSRLGAFLRQAHADGFRACLLFLPDRGGPWLADIQAALAEHPMRIQAFLCFDGWREPQGSAWRRALLSPPPAAGANADELLGLIRALEGPDRNFLLADTRRGEFMDAPEAHLARQRAEVAR